MAPDIAILGTGGTIASTAGEDGATPELTTEELLAAVPQLDELADLRTEQLAQTPGFDVDFETLEAVAESVREAAADGLDGVVVTQGTDSLADAAYYLDATLDVEVPVVHTGAQRRPDETSPDGPSNILTAVRAAIHDAVREGAYVAFDEELHAARHVRKLHTSKLDTFTSPGVGPVASLPRGEVRVHREPRRYAPALPAGPPTATVRTVASGIGVDGDEIRDAVDAGADGIVLEGTGLGNATAALGEAVADAVDRGVPVVVTSRCVAGTTAPVYGTPGGGEGLRQRGAIHAGDLSTAKARLTLLLALQESPDPSDLGTYFDAS